ncbi:transcription factor CP2-like isoform X1 [Argiope bruennichi]|uniref:transcription factor CP2-like isoform X1 n=2 Tax=Argiope bruennichi TaxID=94029 RepID=UPI002495428F|nr:transcription factor CP2-like isoform X1 [Argiope bruennichi]
MEPPGGGLWTMEDLDLLASDLDSSLSGLGGAGTTTFDMSDTLSAIQVIKMNKEDDVLIREQWLRHLSFPDKGLDKVKARSAQNLSTWNFSKSSDRPNSKKPCRAHQEDSLENEEKIRESNGKASILHAPTLCNSLSQYSLQPGFISKAKTDFQYVLAAATSLGTKIGAETLTYLNQGQPYEIRLMKMHGISEMKGKLLKSILRVSFQERRLQFREKMELMAWQSQRPSERILDIDVSLSYGIFDVIPDPENINSCEFMWDPTREASVFIKVNCISTEFTSKRRGGEKGVPFRVVIETYSHWESPARKLDAASCLIKVFKSKGADRKHKTDKEKLEKLPQEEQTELQPSYQYTIFTPCSVTVESIPFQDFSENASFPAYGSSIDSKPDSPNVSTGEVTTSTPSLTSSPQHFPDIKDTLEGMFSPESDDSGILTPNTGVENITANLSTTDVHSWLSRKKFSKYLPCFELYSAKDLLSLSREDIIEICGPSDGIRLYNSLHRREPPPVRRLYISRDNMTFHALYLHSVTCYELQTELCRIYHFPDGAIAEMYITGPNGILLVLTDRVLQNLKDESTFTCEILKAEENGKNTVILRAYIPNQET